MAERKLSVILPVYGDLVSLTSLLGSFEMLDSRNEYLERLLIVNDNPTSEELNQLVSSFVESANFPVTLLKNQANQGFVSSVNRALSEIDKRTDVLLLNSDTQIFPACWDLLSSLVASLERNNIPWCSITPATNSGTIASIPVLGEEHDDFGGLCSPEVVSRICRAVFSLDDLLEFPVGVGFCMLMSREALNELGHFSLDFSPGYGEESDWCMRGVAKGYRNLFFPKLFVYHKGGGSFGEEKLRLLERGEKLILERFPDYNQRLANFLEDENNTRLHRRVVPLLRFASLLEHAKIAVHLLHRDIFEQIGGLEKYVRDVTLYLRAERGVSSVTLAPGLASGIFEIRVDGVLFESCSLDSFFSVCQLLLEEEIVSFESLNFQHVMNWEQSDLELIFSFFDSKVDKKNIIIHDYFLLGVRGAALPFPFFAEASGREDESLFNPPTEKILSEVSYVVFPSEAAQSVFCQAFEESELPQQLICPHYLIEPERGSDCELPQGEQITIAFIGATGFHKGIDRFTQLIKRYQKRFRWMTIGIEDYYAGDFDVLHAHYSQLEGQELSVVLQDVKPGFAFLGSLIPETFSFSLIECLENALPVLTTEESGNIADKVRLLEAGRVFEEFSDLSDYLSRPLAELLEDVRQHSCPCSLAINAYGLDRVYLA